MEFLIETYRKNGKLHHAYLVEGRRNDAFESLVSLLEGEIGFKTKGNPDFWHADFDTLGIDESRMIAELQMRRAAGGGRKVFVIKADFLTHEAQNSLLKVFEEPTEGTHFFLVVPSAERVLPTLRSRVEIVRMVQDKGDGAAAKAFLAAGFGKRMDLLKPYIDAKDKAEALAFVNALERELHGSLKLERANPEELFAFSEIEKVRSYLEDRSPSVKQLLEHLALVIPLRK